MPRKEQPNGGLRDSLDYLRRVIEDRQEIERLRPSQIATETLVRLEGDFLLSGGDDKRRAIYCLAHEQLRHFAEHELKKTGPSTTESDESETLQMFPLLQSRYPSAPSPDCELSMVKRDFMSNDDVSYNVRRLRNKGDVSLRHADQLEQWHGERAQQTIGDSQMAEANPC